VQQVGSQPTELERDRDVLAQAVPRRVLDNGHEVLGEVAERGLVVMLAEEEVGGLVIQAREMAHQVPHIGADAVIAPLARVDRDLHRRR
jgi:hypothetical protein